MKAVADFVDESQLIKKIKKITLTLTLTMIESSEALTHKKT